jgi:transcription initiation factor TFIIH subunit 2
MKSPDAPRLTHDLCSHTPSHGTREVLMVYGALMSSDPGDIHETISALVTDRIRVSVVGLSATVAICAELVSKTNSGDDSGYRIAKHEQHFRDLFLIATTPPATRTKQMSTASLLMMGFPSRTVASGDSIHYCACHNRPTREGFECTRCTSRVCRLPAECPGCGLTLILSTHLARSYHHLFPLRNWVEVPWAQAHMSIACFACQTKFPQAPSATTSQHDRAEAAARNQVVQPLKGLSESGRYACEVCGHHFCIDCDLFAHEVLHNCPGCQSDTRGHHDGNLEVMNGDANGESHVNGSMEVDS